MVEVRRTHMSLEDVRRELDELEALYGVPTERRADAFAADERCSSEDLFWWDALAGSNLRRHG